MKIKFGVGAALIVVGVFLGTLPASAHAVLVSSYPQVEQHLSEIPLYVEVEFDANLIQLGKTKVNVLEVKDSSGVRIDDGNSVTAGPLVKVGLIPKKISGVVKVNWRVVSSDGHPVEGGFTFYVGKVATSTTSPSVAETHHAENYFIHHKIHIAYFVFGFLVIAAWAVISMKILRRRDKL